MIRCCPVLATAIEIPLVPVIVEAVEVIAAVMWTPIATAAAAPAVLPAVATAEPALVPVRAEAEQVHATVIADPVPAVVRGEQVLLPVTATADPDVIVRVVPEVIAVVVIREPVIATQDTGANVTGGRMGVVVMQDLVLLAPVRIEVEKLPVVAIVERSVIV
ncbi:MAG: hypothetical protein Q4A78_07465 [Peptostreptococcaceae bacterium]|nr:hypothetical protein [Peptostreptococcaceae bacterium]